MRTVAVLVALFFASVAAAQIRTIPPDAKRGQMSFVAENRLEVDGRQAQLSPGAQIRDPMNRIIMPATLPAGSAVRYQLDGAGLVHRVWILSPEEADQPEK